MPGIIYCVTNPSMNNYCKVGETGKTIKDRMKGLNNTSIPIPFKLDFFIEIDYCKRFNIEKTIHKEIIKFGYDRLPGKEFFKCNPNDIKHIFEKYGTIKYEEKESVKESVKDVVKESVKESVKCSECNKFFYNKSNLTKHIKINCKVIKQKCKDNKNKEIIINQILNISTITPSSIINNIVKCEKCNITFTCKEHLENHIKNPCVIKLDSKIKSIVNTLLKDVNKPIINEKCPYCNISFYQKHNVIKHVKLNCKIKKELDIQNNYFLNKINICNLK